MITYKTGDIFKEKTEAIVNPVNCVGVAGAGLALKFRKKYPNYYLAYRDVCMKGKLTVGNIFMYKLEGNRPFPKYILSVPTKRHYSDKSILTDIEIGIFGICKMIEKYNIHSISIPALGCGLGGLNWNDVRAVMEDRFRKQQEYKRIVIFEPR